MMTSHDTPDPYPPAYGSSARPPYGGPMPPQAPPPQPRRSTLPTMRIPRPTLGEVGALVGALLVVVGAFLPWSSITLGALQRLTVATSGWESAEGKVVALLGLATLALAVLRLAGVKLPAALAPWERPIYIGLGAEALLLTLLYALDGVRVLSTDGLVSTGAGLGMYLALIGSAAITAGGAAMGNSDSWVR
jgi:hypothetical protein